LALIKSATLERWNVCSNSGICMHISPTLSCVCVHISRPATRTEHLMDLHWNGGVRVLRIVDSCAITWNYNQRA